MTASLPRKAACIALILASALCYGSSAGEIGRFIAVDAASAAPGDGTPAHPFSTIKAAIAKAVNGDTIRVAKGVYAENVVAEKKTLFLKGGYPGVGNFADSNPTANTTEIHAADANASTIKFSIASGQLSGFKITGGMHGVELAGCRDFEISGNIIDGNGSFKSPSGGGGIHLNNVAKVSIRDNEILNNKASDNGGGIGYQRFVACTEMLIENNHLSGNAIAGEHGGGISILGNGTITKNMIERNSSSYGSGIFLDGGAFTCSYNVIRNNASHGIFTIDYSHKGNELCHTLDHNLIYGNKEGVVTFWASLKIMNCTIVDNPGGAFGKREDPVMTITVANSIMRICYLDANALKGMTISYTMADKILPGTGNIAGDPLFACLDKDKQDYHLKSKAGRWDPAASSGKGGWMIDAVSSPAIDAGDPAADFSKEPASNGGRVNLGAYGNTPEASKSQK